jgi:hypothetical protein
MYMTLCEYAAVHDGSVTLVRGGIDRLGSPALPVETLLYTYAECEPGELDIGDHELGLSVVGPNGEEVVSVKGNLNVEKKGAVRVVVPIMGSIATFGEVSVSLKLGALQQTRLVKVEEIVPRNKVAP